MFKLWLGKKQPNQTKPMNGCETFIYCYNSFYFTCTYYRAIVNTGLCRVNCYLCDVSFCEDCRVDETEEDNSNASEAANNNFLANSNILEEIIPRAEAVHWIPFAPPPEEQNPSQNNGRAPPPSYEEATYIVD